MSGSGTCLTVTTMFSGMSLLDRAEQEFGDVQHRQVVGNALGTGAVLQHDHAIWAGRRHALRVRGLQLLDAQMVDPPAAGLLDEDARAPGSAAHSFLPACP